MKNIGFKKIEDGAVRTVWKDDSGELIYMFPCDFCECGIPIDQDSGNDCEYIRTEVLTETKPKKKRT